MKKMVLVVLLSLLALFLVPLQTAKADGPSPWGEILNPDGSIQWGKLVDLGNTSEPAKWMDITLPGGVVIHQDATFHRYRTPSGNVLVLPEPVTLFFMAMHPVESGLKGAHSLLGNGASILMLLLGKSLTPEQLAKMASHGYTDPAQFFQAVIAGRENIWSFINFTYLAELIKMSKDSGYLVNALLLYLNGATNCASIPGGCAGLLAKGCQNGACPGLPILPAICPAPSVAQGTPLLTIQKTAPAHALVVGQDPNKRGADIQITVNIPPVVFTWYETIQDPPVCASAGSGGGHGCPGPGSRYSGSWSPAMENNPVWQVVDGAIHCKKHVDLLPEAITAVKATAQLNPQSQAWILNDLAGKYYEAFIHRPFFALVPEMVSPNAGCGGDQVCSAKALVPVVPFADPGTFDLKLWVTTAGTVFQVHGTAMPITQPRVLNAENNLQVNVTLVTLLPAGAP